MSKRKLAANKKNCSTFNEETLSFDFIYRAFKNNPLEFLNNEELDMILLFARGKTFLLKVLCAVYRVQVSFNPWSMDSLTNALRGNAITEEDTLNFWKICFEDDVKVKVRNAYYAAFCLNPYQNNDEKLGVFVNINNKEIRNKVWNTYNFNLQEIIEKYFSFSVIRDFLKNDFDSNEAIWLKDQKYATLTFKLNTINCSNRIDSTTFFFERTLSRRFFNHLGRVLQVYSEHQEDSLSYINSLNSTLNVIKTNSEELSALADIKNASYGRKAEFYASLTSRKLYGTVYSLVCSKTGWKEVFKNFGALLADGQKLNEDWIIKLFYIHPYKRMDYCSMCLTQQGRNFALALYTSDLPNKTKNNILVGLIKHIFHGVYLGDILELTHSPMTEESFCRLFLNNRPFTTDPNQRRISRKFYFYLDSLFPKKIITELAGEKELWEDLDFIHAVRNAKGIYYSRSVAPRFNTQGRYAIPGVQSPLDTW